MSKTLVLLRHAKSAWPDDVDDHDRPLSGRGLRDAPAVGRWLVDNGVTVELAVVSSARRAMETFALLAAEVEVAPRKIVTDDVYRAGAGELLDLARALPDEVGTALVVGHNPSIGMLAAMLDDRSNGLLDFRTSAVAVFDVGASWADTNPGAARLIASAVPRG